MRKWMLFAALGGLVVMMALTSAPRVDAWYDSNWQYRAEIEILDNYVTGDNFTNFPALIQLTLDNAKTMDNGDDILFCDNTGDVKIPHEVENFNTENLIAWVRVPILRDVENTSIWVYYGNATAAPQENAENVWDNDYKGVWHLDEAAGAFEDSTHFGNDGADTDFVRAVSGQIGAGAEADDTTDKITVTDAAELRITAHITIEAWMYWTGNANVYIMSKDDHSEFAAYTGDAANDVTWYRNFASSTAALIDRDSTWHHLVIVDDQANLLTYVDGVHTGTGVTRTGDSVPAANLCLGSAPDGNVAGDAVWDEMRLSNIARDNNYIHTSFMIQDDPTGAIVVGAEGQLAGISVDFATADNVLIDRDQDVTGSPAILATQVSVQVTQTTAGENRESLTDNVHIWIYDAGANLVVDNAAPIDNTFIDENTIEFHFAVYNPADATLDANLGSFRVYAEATDNASVFDNSDNTSCFVVDDGDDVALTQDNQGGHIHEISGTAARVTGGACTLDNARRVDMMDGTADAAIAGNVFDNTYAPTSNGSVWFELEMNTTLDGLSDNLVYSYPNIGPTIISVSVDNALIDNHATDNGVTTTRITVVFEDNDNYDDFITDFWVAIRDDDVPSLVDNEDVTASATYENENRLVVFMDYDAEDNDFTAAEMGSFDAWYFAGDNWENTSDWDIGTFTVDDILVPVGLAPDNTIMGFAFGYNVLATGTFARMSGLAASINDATLVDSAEGTIAMGSGNAYAENYTIDDSDPGDLVTVTVYAWDDTLDGENENTYLVNENRLFTWNVAAEDNHLAPYNFDNQRTYTLSWFFWDEDNMGLEENISSATGTTIVTESVRVVVLSDNGLYWRALIPENITADLWFYLLQDNANRDLTYEYTYTLEDYTGDFLPEENGSLWVQRLVDNITILINSDYWDGDLTCPVWLLYNIKHQYAVHNGDGDERVVAYYTTSLIYDKNIPVRPLEAEDVVYVWDVITIAAWRDGVSVWVSYDDAGENTENVTITIYEYGETTSVYSYTSTSDSFSLEWNGGDNTTSYEVEFEVYREVAEFDHFVQARAVGPNLLGYEADPPEGVDFLGGPVPLLALLSNGIICIAALAFSARYDVQGMFAITMVAAGLRFLGWLPIDWGIIGLLFALSFFWMLGKGGD